MQENVVYYFVFGYATLNRSVDTGSLAQDEFSDVGYTYLEAVSVSSNYLVDICLTCIADTTAA